MSLLIGGLINWIALSADVRFSSKEISSVRLNAMSWKIRSFSYRIFFTDTFLTLSFFFFQFFFFRQSSMEEMIDMMDWSFTSWEHEKLSWWRWYDDEPCNHLLTIVINDWRNVFFFWFFSTHWATKFRHFKIGSCGMCEKITTERVSVGKWRRR